MDFYLKVNEDKVIARFSEILKMLDQNGEYYVHIERIPDDKPEMQFRAQFFAKMTQLSYHTGYKKQELYDMFKNENGIGSTKGLQNKEDWCKYINTLDWWALNTFDIIL